MQTVTKWLVIVLLWPGSAWAGEIYGTLKQRDLRWFIKGAPIRVQCAPASQYATYTDGYGSYRLNVAERGACTLTVEYEQQTLSLPVYSAENAVRYDLVLEKKNGGYALGRE